MLIDISPPLRAGMPNWPGDTPFSQGFSWRIGPGCPVNVSRIEMSSHIGAHADAPLHYKDDGLAIADLPLDLFIGRCHVVDARGAEGPLIRFEHIAAGLPEHVERLIIRQYETQPLTWDGALKGLDPAMIPLLAARGVRLIGVDANTVDPADSKTLDAHRAIDRHAMVIVEGLKLDAVSAGEYELIAPPLKIEGCDAAPLRAVLRALPVLPL